MRKITSLLILLCMFVGTAWAGPTDLPEITTDLENPIYYTIYNTRSSQPGGLMYYAGDEVGMKDGCTSPTLEDKYKFYFTGSHDALYVHNAATTKKLASVSSWTDEGTVWAVGVSPKGGGLAFGPQGGLNGNSCWNEKNYTTDANTSDFTIWSANDDGSIFVAELASEYTFPETDKFYTIECPLFESVQGVKKGLYVTEEGALAWGNVDLTNKKHYWVPTVDAVNNTVVLKNLGTSKYLNGTEMADAEVNATLNALSSTQFNIKVNGTTVHANGHGNGANASGSIVNYEGSANSASAWTFVEQENPDAVTTVIIRYSFTYNDEEKYTQETKTLVGQEYPAITTTFPFGVSATKPEGTIPNEGIVDGVKTVEIALSVNLPFVPAADNASIEHWYYIQMHSNPEHTKYIQYMDTYIEWADVNVDVADMDSYTWALVGNPFDGFKLVNKAAGIDKAVNSTGSDNPAIGEYASGVVWEIKNSATNNDNEHFCLKFPGGQYMNAQNGKIAFWGSADQGSTMWVTERDLTGATELQALIDQVEAAQGNYVAGTTVGYLTQASVDAVAQAVAEAKTYLASGSVTAEKSAEHQSAINDAIAALETVQPEVGKFYNIVSSCTRDHRANQQVYVNNSGTMHFANVVDALATSLGHVFQFVPASDGKFYIYNVERGVYMQTIGTASETDVANAKPVTIANMGKDNIVSIKPDGQSLMHAQDANSIIVGWDSPEYDNGSAWRLVEVGMETVSHPVTVTEAGWATLVLGCDATIPAGVTAYAVSAVGEGYATLTEVTTGTIPANEAVLLNAAAGTYEFKYAAESTPIENELVGTVFDTNVAADAYVLSKQNDVVGFYKAELNLEENAKFKNNAFKAYLPATAGGGEARFLVFNFGDDNATAIENIQGAENATNAVVYDLAGRRVQNAQKGIFIVNGKKVVK